MLLLLEAAQGRGLLDVTRVERGVHGPAEGVRRVGRRGRRRAPVPHLGAHLVRFGSELVEHAPGLAVGLLDQGQQQVLGVDDGAADPAGLPGGAVRTWRVRGARASTPAGGPGSGR